MRAAGSSPCSGPRIDRGGGPARWPRRSGGCEFVAYSEANSFLRVFNCALRRATIEECI